MINLLPPEYKLELAGEYKRRVVLVSLYAFLVALLITLFALVPAYITAQVRLNELDTELQAMTNSTATDENKSVAQVVADVNAKLAQYDQIKNSVKTTPLLKQFLENPPVGIILEQLQFDSGAMTLSLQGTAKTRDMLLVFQKTLKSFSNVTDANVPISSFVKQKDVSFNIIVTLKR